MVARDSLFLMHLVDSKVIIKHYPTHHESLTAAYPLHYNNFCDLAWGARSEDND